MGSSAQTMESHKETAKDGAMGKGLRSGFYGLGHPRIPIVRSILNWDFLEPHTMELGRGWF